MAVMVAGIGSNGTMDNVHGNSGNSIGSDNGDRGNRDGIKNGSYVDSSERDDSNIDCRKGDSGCHMIKNFKANNIILL